ncbi:MAG: hypothetical protein OJF51_003423 [Nitrospira sp.]|nr:MAG: hypothetical protein OJF51_003423 [Nitrospira sp.]
MVEYGVWPFLRRQTPRQRFLGSDCEAVGRGRGEKTEE